ncbi:MAG TPA: NAD(P)H-dependent oxidoreductase [Phycisphaerae bacterium]|nr:NAD(P)H-dependent oxidoreductase [Phycisphaerae bacterium]
MAKVLVVYYSRSGSTGQMAEEVAAGAREVKGARVELKKVAEVDPKGLSRYDALIIGSPTYYGLMAAEIKKMFDESVAIHGQLEGKVGGAFTSAANLAGGNETTILSILEAMLVHGMIVKGTSRRDHYGPVAIGKPDERAVEQSRLLGREVAELAVKLHG